MAGSTNDAVESRGSLQNRSSSRIEWIDIAKGIGIVLVTFGHLRNGDGYGVWLPALNLTIEIIYLFHMPLFFFLGGLTFSAHVGFKDFLIKKARTLLIPYYFFSLYFLAKPIACLLIPSLAQTFQTGYDFDLLYQLWDVFIMGNGLWFFMAYFVAEIIMYWVYKAIGDKRALFALVGCLFILIASATDHIWPGFQLPFQLIMGVGVAGYMSLGIVCKDTLLGAKNKFVDAGIALFAAAVFLFCVWTMVTGLCVSTKWIVDIFAALSGTAATVFLAIIIARAPVLEYIGRNSAVFYAVNALTMNVVKYGVFRLLGIDVTGTSFMVQFATGLVITAIALLILWGANVVIRRWLPWSLGIWPDKKLPGLTKDNN